MYLDYLEETSTKKTYEVVGKGFAVYDYTELDGNKAVYIEEIYTKPEFRKTHLASDIASEIYKIARKLGCSIALGSAHITNKKCADSIKVLLAHGMRPLKADDQLIWFYKEI